MWLSVVVNLKDGMCSSGCSLAIRIRNGGLMICWPHITRWCQRHATQMKRGSLPVRLMEDASNVNPCSTQNFKFHERWHAWFSGFRSNDETDLTVGRSTGTFHYACLLLGKNVHCKIEQHCKVGNSRMAECNSEKGLRKLIGTADYNTVRRCHPGCPGGVCTALTTRLSTPSWLSGVGDLEKYSSNNTSRTPQPITGAFLAGGQSELSRECITGHALLSQSESPFYFTKTRVILVMFTPPGNIIEASPQDPASDTYTSVWHGHDPHPVWSRGDLVDGLAGGCQHPLDSVARPADSTIAPLPSFGRSPSSTPLRPVFVDAEEGTQRDSGGTIHESDHHVAQDSHQDTPPTPHPYPLPHDGSKTLKPPLPAYPIPDPRSFSSTSSSPPSYNYPPGPHSSDYHLHPHRHTSHNHSSHPGVSAPSLQYLGSSISASSSFVDRRFAPSSLYLTSAAERQSTRKAGARWTLRTERVDAVQVLFWVGFIAPWCWLIGGMAHHFIPFCARESVRVLQWGWRERPASALDRKEREHGELRCKEDAAWVSVRGAFCAELDAAFV
ncbi:hypothetical protein BU15DRAFT_62265 [Melanogaster broomeanus]|nr:hypothetical protein BU15DRAFT_62265 [Melanogaster broomeanus]